MLTFLFLSTQNTTIRMSYLIISINCGNVISGCKKFQILIPWFMPFMSKMFYRKSDSLQNYKMLLNFVFIHYCIYFIGTRVLSYFHLHLYVFLSIVVAGALGFSHGLQSFTWRERIHKVRPQNHLPPKHRGLLISSVSGLCHSPCISFISHPSFLHMVRSSGCWGLHVFISSAFPGKKSC